MDSTSYERRLREDERRKVLAELSGMAPVPTRFAAAGPPVSSGAAGSIIAPSDRQPLVPTSLPGITGNVVAPSSSVPRGGFAGYGEPAMSPGAPAVGPGEQDNLTPTPFRRPVPAPDSSPDENSPDVEVITLKDLGRRKSALKWDIACKRTLMLQVNSVFDLLDVWLLDVAPGAVLGVETLSEKGTSRRT